MKETYHPTTGNTLIFLKQVFSNSGDIARNVFGTFQPNVFDLQAQDPYFASMVSELHMDGTNGGTTFTDVNGRTWTALGNAQTSTGTPSPIFGTASGKFDGTGDYLTSPAGTAWDIGSGDFTAEAWVYPTTTTKLMAICGNQRNVAGTFTGWVLYVDANGFPSFSARKTAGGVAVSITSGTALGGNSWDHIAITRDSSSSPAGLYRLFVDGLLQGSAYETGAYVGAALSRLTIARWDNDVTTTRDWQGNIDELRVTVGACRYKTSFRLQDRPSPDS